MNEPLIRTVNTLIEVRLERERQDEKWGEQNHGPADWSLILGEEYGEAMKAATEARFGPTGEDGRPASEMSLREELIHTAAVAVAWVECIDRHRQ